MAGTPATLEAALVASQLRESRHQGRTFFGAVAQLFGAPFAVVTGGIGCILAVIGIARRWPQLTSYNGDEPIKVGATAD